MCLEKIKNNVEREEKVRTCCCQVSHRRKKLKKRIHQTESSCHKMNIFLRAYCKKKSKEANCEEKHDLPQWLTEIERFIDFLCSKNSLIIINGASPCCCTS